VATHDVDDTAGAVVWRSPIADPADVIVPAGDRAELELLLTSRCRGALPVVGESER
jgi:hypothetical protein